MSDLVSNKMPITKHPYCKIEVYRKRLSNINYSYFRYIKRDGNCFYNAFSTLYFEKISGLGKTYFESLKSKMNEFIEEIKRRNENLMVFECFYETFIEVYEMRIKKIVVNEDESESTKKDIETSMNLDKNHNNTHEKDTGIKDSTLEHTSSKKFDQNDTINDGSIEQSSIEHIDMSNGNDYKALEEDLNSYNDNIWKYPANCDIPYNDIVAFYKMLISLHMKSNKEKYEPFVGDIEDYTKKRVDTFYVDASDVEINILAEILDIGIKIIYIDQDFEQVSGNQNNMITLLFTHGHFEPLFA